MSITVFFIAFCVMLIHITAYLFLAPRGGVSRLWCRTQLRCHEWVRGEWCLLRHATWASHCMPTNWQQHPALKSAALPTDETSAKHIREAMWEFIFILQNKAMLLTVTITLALSISCRTSVRLEGFRYPGTEVSCPRYYNSNNNNIDLEPF